jgi:transglutaminase-like putative cysteine protease
MRDCLASLPIPKRLLGLLLLVLGLMMAPHAANLDAAILAFFYGAVAWRVGAIRQPRSLPGRWTLLALTVAALALVMFSSDLADGRTAGTALLVVMLGLKLLELRARRDIHVTVFLGYFLALTQFLYNQSLWLAIYLFVGVLALTVIQVGLNRVRIDLRLQLRNTGYMLAAALPLAVVLFLLFPRLDTPLWAINQASATTGISGDMTVGDISRLSQSNEIAFRVRFLGAEPTPEQRYWRGPVLWQTDGRHWTAGARALRQLSPGEVAEPPVRYEVTLEPTGEYWLFGLDLVTELPAGTRINHNHALVADQRVNDRFTYVAGSDPAQRPGGLSVYQRELGLQLPEEVSPRVSELAEQWRASGDGDALSIAARALQYFREQPFVYTLAPGRLGDDPVDQFLFETRRGFCEHYASSFVTLMRLAGVPARVVIGYQGGERNPHAEHWIVRQSDAHAWAEIWSPADGWVRIDPTAAVAPERIERAIDASASRAGGRVVFDTGAGGLFGDLWQNAVWIADAVDLGWHRWVVGFSAKRQSSLLESLGIENLQGMGLAVALIVGCGLAIAVVYLVSRLPRPVRRDPLPRLWHQFTAKLVRAGIHPHPWEGADTVCAHAMQAFPAATGELVAINRLYVQLRYGRRGDPRQLQALRERIRALRLR